MFRRLLSLALLVAPATSRAATYTFQSLPDQQVGKVTVRLNGTTSQAFHLPAWAPGDYEIFDYGKTVVSIAFTKNGQAVAYNHPGPDLWTVPEGADQVVYTIKPSAGNFSLNLKVTPQETFVSPSGVFGWFDGHAHERQKLAIQKLPAGTRVVDALDSVSDDQKQSVYEAPDFDKLVDFPFVMGSTVRVKEFKVHGKDMAICGFGTPSGGDIDGYAEMGAKVAEQGFQIFGEIPWKKYVFFVNFGRFGGGLEHLNGTSLSVGNLNGARAAGLIFHEYFHCYNVKRIRPLPLGPFDYTKPAVTGSLWWLEGVTDYYAEIMQVRAGIKPREDSLDGFGRNFGSFTNNPARLQISAEEASRRVWDVHGSDGFGGISYYEKGRLAGFCLDMEIRAMTDGQRCLDDVMRGLWDECKNDRPGFSEDRIRELCIKVGGPMMGPFYDTCIRQAVDFPLDTLLPQVGLRLDDTGFSNDPNALPEVGKIGAQWPMAPGK